MEMMASGMGKRVFLLVYIAQDTTCSVHYISDGGFREQPVRWHGRIQAEVRGTTGGVLVVSIQTLKCLHRATKEAIGILRITMLPVEPYFINHSMMHIEEWVVR